MRRALDYLAFVGAGLGLVLALLALNTEILGPLTPWALILAAVLILGGLVGLLIEATRPLIRLREFLVDQAHSLDQRLGRPRVVRTLAKRIAATPLKDVPKGFLDYEKQMLETTLSTAAVLGKITKETDGATKRIEKGTARTVQARGASVERRLRVSSGVAKDMDRFTQRLEALEDEYRVATGGMIDGGLGWLRTAPEGNDFSVFAVQVSKLRDSTIGYRESIRGSRTAMKAGRDVNVSQDVNRAYDRAIDILSKLLQDVERVIAYLDEANRLSRQRVRQVSKRPKPPRAGRSTSSAAGSQP
jgi:hypothetical protein